LGGDFLADLVEYDRVGGAEVAGRTLIDFVLVVDPDLAVAHGPVALNEGKRELHVRQLLLDRQNLLCIRVQARVQQ